MRILVLQPPARDEIAGRDQRLDHGPVGVALLALVIEHPPPFEARRAIDFVEWAKENINVRKWNTTIAHEYNVMTNYQRHIDHVYITVQEVRKMCRDELEWGDNPAVKKILERLDYMHQECLKART